MSRGHPFISVQQIIDLRAKHPHITNGEIARRLGVSRQAVWLRAKSNSLAGDNRAPTKWCLQCESIIAKQRRFCSSACRSKYLKTELNCDVCGNAFTRSTKYLLYRMQHPWSNTGRTQQWFTCSLKCRDKLWSKMGPAMRKVQKELHAADDKHGQGTTTGTDI